MMIPEHTICDCHGGGLDRMSDWWQRNTRMPARGTRRSSAEVCATDVQCSQHTRVSDVLAGRRAPDTTAAAVLAPLQSWRELSRAALLASTAQPAESRGWSLLSPECCPVQSPSLQLSGCRSTAGQLNTPAAPEPRPLNALHSCCSVATARGSDVDSVGT